MKKCGECKHFKNCRPDYYRNFPACATFDELTNTNFDNITASPEALADALYRENSNEWPIWCKGHICKSSCKECFIDWLKQKAEDEE